MSTPASCIYIGDDAENRSRFRQMLRMIPSLRVLKFFLSRVDLSLFKEQVDYIFLDASALAAKPEILQTLREIPSLQNSATILVQRSQPAQAGTDWECDATLQSPFSAADIEAAMKGARTSQGLKRRYEARRIIRLLVREIGEQLNATANLLSLGAHAALSRTILREMCLSLEDLSPEMLENYFEILADDFGNQRPSQRGGPPPDEKVQESEVERLHAEQLERAEKALLASSSPFKKIIGL